MGGERFKFWIKVSSRIYIQVYMKGVTITVQGTRQETLLDCPRGSSAHEPGLEAESQIIVE